MERGGSTNARNLLNLQKQKLAFDPILKNRQAIAVLKQLMLDKPYPQTLLEQQRRLTALEPPHD